MAPVRKNLIWISSLILFASCAIKVKVPANRFDSPETMGGHFRIKLNGGIGGTHSVLLTEDYLTKAPDTTNPTHERSTFLRLGGGLSILENLDVEIRNFNQLLGKYQLAGDSRQRAQAGNFALSVTGTIGYQSSKETGTPLSSGNKSITVKMTEVLLDAGLISGYRVADWLLLYGGPVVSRKQFWGTYQPTSTANVTTSSEFSGGVMSFGGNLGLELGIPAFQFRTEVAYTDVKLGNLKTGRAYFGVEIAVVFGGREPPKNEITPTSPTS